MNVDFAFICDYAEATNKVNAIGIGFDRIYARTLPAKHPHFSVVIQLRFHRTETGTKEVSIHLIDADGSDVIKPVNGQMNVQAPPPEILELTSRLVMEFGNVEFKQYGDYSIKINVAGEEVASIPLAISQPPVQA